MDDPWPKCPLDFGMEGSLVPITVVLKVRGELTPGCPASSSVLMVRVAETKKNPLPTPRGYGAVAWVIVTWEVTNLE